MAEQSTGGAPATVEAEGTRALYAIANDIRGAIKIVAQQVKSMANAAKSSEAPASPDEDRGETIANIMITYRHLEDASMRLGKVLQAMDGGVSVYDKATTVGAPDK